MPQDSDFIAVAAATPLDDPARLVYADWLEEKGDPRGEFIRLQARMIGLSPCADEYVRLKPRRAELRNQIDPAWIAAMDYLPKHRPLFTKLPAQRHERWRLVEEFIDVWHGPLQPGDGYTEQELADAEQRLGLRLPAALREWYALAGKRKNIWSHQDALFSLTQMHVDSDTELLLIRMENQGNERWGIRLDSLNLEDPPIMELEEPRQVASTTSAFAIQVLLYEAKFADHLIWAGDEIIDPEIHERVIEKFDLCDLPNTYWVATPIYFYEGPDLIVERSSDYWIYVTARTEKAFADLGETMRHQLERYK